MSNWGTTSSTWTGTATTNFNLAYRPMVDPMVDHGPEVRGSGPLVASSSRALARRPLIIWDVNCYYRDLGIRFPYRPTRSEIRQAWFAKDPGARYGRPRNARLIFVFRQLLDDRVRDAYDNCPHGEVFLDDYVRALIRRKAVEEAHRRARLAGFNVVDDAELVADFERSVYSEMGFDVDHEEEDDTPSEALDATPPPAQDVARPATFGFAYFVWRIHAIGLSDQPLSEWQSMVGSALAERSITTRFAVGLHHRMPQSYLILTVGDILVFLLHQEQTPTPFLARSAVAQWLGDFSRSLRSRER